MPILRPNHLPAAGNLGPKEKATPVATTNGAAIVISVENKPINNNITKALLLLQLPKNGSKII